MAADDTKRFLFARQYSKLLIGPAGGHALLQPQESETGGGKIGDLGSIVGGKFWMDSNVLESGGPCERFAPKVERDKNWAKITMSSCETAKFKFELTTEAASAASAGFVEPPLETVHVQARISFSKETDAFAFLFPVKPSRWDIMAPSAHKELCFWLGDQDPSFFADKIIVTEVLRASGFVGGLRVSRKAAISVGLQATLGSGLSSNSGGSAEEGQSLHVNLRGPENWYSEADNPPMYSLMINYAYPITRLSYYQRAKAAVGLSKKVPPSTPHLGPSTGAPGTSSTSQTSTQANPGSSTSAPQQEHGSPPPSESDIDDTSPLWPVFGLIFKQHPIVTVAVVDLGIVCRFFNDNPIALGEPTTLRLCTKVDKKYVSAGPDSPGAPGKVIGVLESLYEHQRDGIDFTIEPAWICHTTRYVPYVGEAMLDGRDAARVHVTEVHPEKSSASVSVDKYDAYAPPRIIPLKHLLPVPESTYH